MKKIINEIKVKNALVRIKPYDLLNVLSDILDCKLPSIILAIKEEEEYEKARNTARLKMDPILEFDSFICELKDAQFVIDFIDFYECKIRKSRNLEDLEEMKIIIKTLGVKFSFENKKEDIKYILRNSFFSSGWIAITKHNCKNISLTEDETSLLLNNE